MKTLALALALVTTSAFAAKVVVPSEDLLIAAKSIRAQSNTYYSAQGSIFCQSLNTGWSPATESCSIEMNGVSVDLTNPGKIIGAVSQVIPPRGPFYSFAGQFDVTSQVTDFPPYVGTESAFITVE